MGTSRAAGGNGSNGSKNGGIGTHLPIAISTALMLIAIFGGFWSLADPRGQLQKLEARFGDYIANAEFRQYQELINREDRRQSADIEKLQQLTSVEMARRAETIEKVRTIEKLNDQQQVQIDELRRILGASVTLADVIKKIESDLAELRRNQLSTAKELGPAPATPPR